MNEHYAFFDFDEARYLVRYKSDKDIGDEIEDAIMSYADSIGEENCDDEYEDVVKDIMDSFNVEWEFVPCRKYWC